MAGLDDMAGRDPTRPPGHDARIPACRVQRRAAAGQDGGRLRPCSASSEKTEPSSARGPLAPAAARLELLGGLVLLGRRGLRRQSG